MALRRVSILGLGSMPQNSTKRPERQRTTWSYTAFFDGAAAESNHDLLVGRNLFRQLDGAFAEDQSWTGFWKVKLFIRFSFILFVFSPDELLQGSFRRGELLFQAHILCRIFALPFVPGLLSAFVLRTWVAEFGSWPGKSNDLAARSISSRARAICVSMLSVE